MNVSVCMCVKINDYFLSLIILKHVEVRSLNFLSRFRVFSLTGAVQSNLNSFDQFFPLVISLDNSSTVRFDWNFLFYFVCVCVLIYDTKRKIIKSEKFQTFVFFSFP